MNELSTRGLKAWVQFICPSYWGWPLFALKTGLTGSV